jgi:hypothetical protein
MMLRSGILILHGVHMEVEEEVELEVLQSRHICRYQEIYEAQDLIRDASATIRKGQGCCLGKEVPRFSRGA